MSLAITKSERIIREKLETERKGKEFALRTLTVRRAIENATDVQVYRSVLHDMVR